jgi:hypothetical protein
MKRKGRSTIIEIDVRDYLDEFSDEILDAVDCRYVRDNLQDARRCLNRPERSLSEAIEYIERALGTVTKALGNGYQSVG